MAPSIKYSNNLYLNYYKTLSLSHYTYYVHFLLIILSNYLKVNWIRCFKIWLIIELVITSAYFSHFKEFVRNYLLIVLLIMERVSLHFYFFMHCFAKFNWILIYNFLYFGSNYFRYSQYCLK